MKNIKNDEFLEIVKKKQKQNEKSRQEKLKQIEEKNLRDLTIQKEKLKIYEESKVGK